jgi:hypothetical protein
MDVAATQQCLYLCGPYRCVITKFGRFMLTNTIRQFIITNTLYGQHVSAIAISHHQASQRKTQTQCSKGLARTFFCVRPDDG